MPPNTSVLILSPEPIVAALVGLLVESIGLRPLFHEPDEAPSDALRRLRPLAVVLVDADMSLGSADLFFRLAESKQIVRAVFGSSRRARTIAELAAHHRVPWFTMPTEAEGLTELFAKLLPDAGLLSRSSDRRRPSEAILADDGALILHDSEGRRWIVFDRRGGERRTTTAVISEMRIFVSDDGETRRGECIAPLHAGVSLHDLEIEIARALPD